MGKSPHNTDCMASGEENCRGIYATQHLQQSKVPELIKPFKNIYLILLHAKHSTFFFFFFRHVHGILFPTRIEPAAPHWEGGLTSEPGKSPGTVLDTSVIKTVRSPALGELVLSRQKIQNNCEKAVNRGRL